MPASKKKKNSGNCDAPLTRPMSLLMFLVNSEPEPVIHSPQDLSLWEYSLHGSQATKANGSGDKKKNRLILSSYKLNTHLAQRLIYLLRLFKPLKIQTITKSDTS